MNRIVEYDSAVKKALYSTKDMLEELSWTHPSPTATLRSKSRSKTEKMIGSNVKPDNTSNKVKYYLEELWYLIQEYENHIKNNPIFIPKAPSPKEDDFDEEGHNALIEQL